MKKAQRIEKGIKYKLNYSNLSFDFWMVLHKINCNESLNFPYQYFSFVNKAYGEFFQSMDDYKKEANFKRMLKKLSKSEQIKSFIDKNIGKINKREKMKTFQDINKITV